MLAVRRGTLGIALLASLAFNAGVGVTFGVKAYQRTGGGPPSCEPRRGEDAFFDALGLRPEQRESFKADREQLMKELAPLFEQLRSASTALTDLLSAQPPDREAIGARLDQISALRRQMQQVVVDHVLASMTLLDEQQLQIFKETMLRRLPMIGGWGPGPGGPPDHRGSSHSGWRRHDDDDHERDSDRARWREEERPGGRPEGT